MPRVDFAVDPTLHDLVFTADGLDVVLYEDDTDEPDLIAQDAGQMMASNAGEWAWDQDFGLPFLSLIFANPVPSVSTIEGLVRAKLLERPGITSVPRTSLAIDRAAKKLTGWIEIRFTTGTVTKVVV